MRGDGVERLPGDEAVNGCSESRSFIITARSVLDATLAIENKERRVTDVYISCTIAIGKLQQSAKAVGNNLKLELVALYITGDLMFVFRRKSEENNITRVILTDHTVELWHFVPANDASCRPKRNDGNLAPHISEIDSRTI